jgi:hypothetical protein
VRGVPLGAGGGELLAAVAADLALRTRASPLAAPLLKPFYLDDLLQVASGLGTRVRHRT